MPSSAEKVDAREAVAAATGHQSRAKVPTKASRPQSKAAAPDSRTVVTLAQRRRDRTPLFLWNTTQAQRERLEAIRRHIRGHDAKAQARRILAALLGGPATTYELRDLLDAMQCGARICELRKAGHPIDMDWVLQVGPMGETHRVACYRLISEGVH